VRCSRKSRCVLIAIEPRRHYSPALEDLSVRSKEMVNENS
jgi:hypothetical protein